MPRLEERALDHQDPAPAIRLEVAAGDERVTQQERKHVIAVDPFRRRRVQLYGVFHSEEALDAAPVPDQRVERSDERSHINGPGYARVGVNVGLFLPSVDSGLQE